MGAISGICGWSFHQAEGIGVSDGAAALRERARLEFNHHERRAGILALKTSGWSEQIKALSSLDTSFLVRRRSRDANSGAILRAVTLGSKAVPAAGEAGGLVSRVLYNAEQAQCIASWHIGGFAMPKTMVPLSRREFVYSVCALPLVLQLKAQSAEPMPWDGPATVARVYLANPEIHWPKPTLDAGKDIAEVEARLAEVERKNAGNVRFVGGQVLRADAEVRPWLATMGEIDGVLIVPVTQPLPGLQTLVDALEVPALFFSRPYATHQWSAIAGLRRGGKKLDVVASSSYGDLDPYLRAFRSVHHMRKSKVLVGVASPGGRQATVDGYSKHFGTTFKFVTGPELKAAFDAADAREAQKAADEFVRGALRVVEPSPKEIHDGLRFYLALREMLRREKANAFTIDCFGSLPARTLPGYPCIAWSKFNDAGLYGVCEADLASTMTQLLISSYAGVPGFVSDPVFDTSRNEVIHAHCVSATKMKGPNAPASPYIVRNHLETNEGAVLQVLMPSSETVTVARFTNPRRLLISTAEVTGPVDSDRGCRTQIRTRVSNAEKWLESFGDGLHRVIFYGDHVQAVERMGRLMGFEVVHEI